MSGTDQSLIYSDMKLSDFDEILDFHDEHFFNKEAMQLGCHHTKEDHHSWAVEAMRAFIASNVSVVARDPSSGALAGTSINTVLTRENPVTFGGAGNSTRPNVLRFHAGMSALEGSLDYFALLPALSRVLEVAFLTVAEEYAGRGVAKRLVQESERRGVAVGCQLATAQATARASQRAFTRQGYKLYLEKVYSEFTYEGGPLYDQSVMGDNPTVQLLAKQLQ